MRRDLRGVMLGVDFHGVVVVRLLSGVFYLSNFSKNEVHDSVLS